MSNKCVICHRTIPIKPGHQLINGVYSKAEFVSPSYWNSQKKMWSKAISDQTYYFCTRHTPKQKADAMMLLVDGTDPYKKSRFDDIIQ
jgi:hypothetical protein